MSDTPETDAAERMAYSQEYMVPTEVARKLERERDEAREEWGKASMDAAQLLSEKTYVIAERDEAREFCFQMVDLIAYGLGQNGSFWSQKAMSEAREAISKAKALEAAK